MEKIIIIGGGGHAKSLINLIQKIKRFNIIGYVDNKDSGLILGINCLGGKKLLKSIKQKHANISAAIGVGYVQISQKRKKIFDELSLLGFKLPSIVSPDAVINQHVKFGQGTVVFDGSVIGVDTQIGDGAIINTCASIDHDC